MTKPTFAEMRVGALDVALTIEGVRGGNANTFYVETLSTAGAEDRLQRAAVAVALFYESKGMSAKGAKFPYRGLCPLTGKDVLRLNIVTPPFGASCYAPGSTDPTAQYTTDRRYVRRRRVS